MRYEINNEAEPALVFVNLLHYIQCAHMVLGVYVPNL